MNDSIDLIDSMFLMCVFTIHAALAIHLGRAIRRRKEVG